jgi:hypothetical protein
MFRLFRVAALLAALALLAASPAAAATPLRASLEGHIVGFNQDPAAVAARCPPGSPQAILQIAGSGVLTSEAYAGPVEFSEEHCSLLLVVTNHDLAVGYIRAGLMTMVTPGGDTLSFAYKLPGVFTGDLTLVGPSEHSANGPFTITGGTGIFAGASGHGHVGGLADSTSAGIGLNGSLQLPG